MEEILKAILLEAMSGRAKKTMEQPTILSFEKKTGLNSEFTTKIEGTATSVITGCTILLLKVIKMASPECKAMQKEILEMIYKMVVEKLELK
jgi:hypothetical protein